MQIAADVGQSEAEDLSIKCSIVPKELNNDERSQSFNDLIVLMVFSTVKLKEITS